MEERKVSISLSVLFCSPYKDSATQSAKSTVQILLMLFFKFLLFDITLVFMVIDDSKIKKNI